jgi:hypothetical protein
MTWLEGLLEVWEKRVAKWQRTPRQDTTTRTPVVITWEILGT